MNQSLHQKVGILGGGQLGKMLSTAAAPWSLSLKMLDQTPETEGNSQVFRGNPTNYDDVMEFGKDKDIVTIEKEDVNTDALIQLQKDGVEVYPKPESLKIIQDKYIQKCFYRDNNFKTSGFYNIEKNELIEKVQSGEQKFPFILKHRTAGYDGKGVALIKDIKELDELSDGDYLVEELINIKQELSIIVARNTKGEMACYDAIGIETSKEGFLMDQIQVPAKDASEFQKELEVIATRLISTFEIVGLLAIEFFIDNNNVIYVNEVSPRPHNTGHHTIDTSVTSQYEQHLRAILGLPLGESKSSDHAICMNVLGPTNGEGTPQYLGVDKVLALPRAHIHLYGKKLSRPLRKLGHITIVADNEEQLKSIQHQVNEHFKVVV